MTAQAAIALAPTEERTATAVPAVSPLLPPAGERFNVLDFDATGDERADDTAAIMAAATAAAESGGTLWFPDTGGKYRITYRDTPDGRRIPGVAIPAGVGVVMDAPILYDAPEDGVALRIGSPGVDTRMKTFELRVERPTWSDWASEDSLGLELVNLVECRVGIISAIHFTIGARCLGDGRGFAHNVVHLGRLQHNRIGLDVTNVNGGWANENLFLGGHFAVSRHPEHECLSRCGIRIDSIDERYYNNNLYFLKPSFELGGPEAGEAGALPVLARFATSCRVESARSEGNALERPGSRTAPFARVLNASRHNVFDLGVAYDGRIVEDLSCEPSSFITSRVSTLDRQNLASWHSGPLHRRAIHAFEGSSGTHVHVAGVHVASSTSAAVRARNSLIELEGDGAVVLSPRRALGVFLATGSHKRFVVRRDVELLDGDGRDGAGRVMFRCYDRAGEVLDGADACPAYATGRGGSLSWHSSFGGVYRTGSDHALDVFVAFHSAVHRVAVLCGGGTHPTRLRSFAISSIDGGSPTVWAGYTEVVPGSNQGAAPPLDGDWEPGRMLWNEAPAAGQPLGWVYDGSSWREFATL